VLSPTAQGRKEGQGVVRVREGDKGPFPVGPKLRVGGGVVHIWQTDTAPLQMRGPPVGWTTLGPNLTFPSYFL
jgi:hypothetical protein